VSCLELAEHNPVKINACLLKVSCFFVLAAPISSQRASAAATDDKAIRPFLVNVPEGAIVDLRRRVVATRWPDKETVTDRSQGTQLDKIRALVRYWGGTLR
jgi:hypothetical protein